MKRERDFSTKQRKKLAKKNAALPGGSFPIVTTGDLKNAIKAVGRAKNYDAAKAHIIKRAKALGATSMLPDDWKPKPAKQSGECGVMEVRRVEAVRLLQARLTEANGAPERLDDVLFGLRALIEATADSARAKPLPEGRIGILEDLRRKIVAAETTHDPQVIENLLQAFSAFLDEEAAEEDDDTNTEEEDPMGKKKKESRAEEESRHEEESAEEGKEESGEEEGKEEAQEGAAEEAQAEAGAEVHSFRCEACGHENAIPCAADDDEQDGDGSDGQEGLMGYEAARESAAGNGKPSKREAKKPATPAETEATPAAATGGTKLTEVERQELVVLRAEKRQREKFVKAREAIRKEKADGFLEAADLVSFDETQWPTMINLAKNAAPLRSYGGGERPMPAPSARRQPQQSARQLFESLRESAH